MPRDRGPAGGGDVEVVDLADDPSGDHEDLEDLEEDEPDDGPHRATGRGGRPRWLRSRWVLPLLVVLLVLLLEVTAGRQLRAVAAHDLAQSQQLSALQLGGASVVSAYSGDPATYDEQGRLLTTVQVQLLNSGEQAVRVQVRGTSEPLLQLVGEQRETAVGPDGSNVLSLRTAVDCSQAPAVKTVYSSEDARAAQAFSLDLDVAVQGDGEDRGGPAQRRRYLVSDSGFGWNDVTQQLAYACDPTTNGTLAVSSTPRDDGAMVMQVRNDSAVPQRVRLEATPWLRASTDVALPVAVPPRSELPVVVTLRPDCSAAATAEDGGLDLRAELVRDGEDGDGQSVTYDSLRTTVWAVRQVALACG